MPNPPASNTFTRRDAAFILGALAFAAAVRAVFYGGIFSPDEANYLRNAGAWWTGRFELKNALFLHDTRPIMFVPVAWSFAAFGVSEATAILWPFVASLAVVGCVYGITLRLIDRETAAYAAFCSALFPLLAQEGSRLLPGAPMNLLTVLCALFFVVSEQSRRRWRLWLFLSGAAFAAIQSVGELGIVLGLMFPAAALAWRRRSIWSYWPVAAGFAAVTALIAAHYWAETGTPLFKLELSRDVYAQVKAVAPRQPLYYVRLMAAPFGGGGGVFYLAGIGVIAAVAQRRRAALFLTLWAGLTWLLLEFGSVSLTEYQQLSKEVRYFSVVSVPAVILAGYGMAFVRRLASNRGGRPGGGAAVAVMAAMVVGLSASTLQSAKEARQSQTAALRELRDEVRRHRGEPVYVTHWMWNTHVGFFMGFEKDYLPSGYDPYHAVNLQFADSTSLNRYVQTLRPGETIGPGLLVHDERLFELSRGEGSSWSVRRGEIPETLADIPPEWGLVDRIPVSSRYLLALYDIPAGAGWPETPDRPAR